MKFGEYLRKARDKAGWTQPEAAAKIGIEQSYLSKVETGKSYPSEEVFDEIVKAYDINVDSMSKSVSSDELDKLRDVASLRTVILNQQKTATDYLRGWMLAGLIMIMLGSGLLIGQSQQTDTIVITYRYQSPGVIYQDEPTLIFEQLSNQRGKELTACRVKIQKLAAKNGKSDENCERFLEETAEALAARTDYDILDTTDYLGPTFVRTLDDGNRRRYELIDKNKMLRQSWVDYLHAIGVALLLGGFISCFYIGRNWR